MITDQTIKIWQTRLRGRYCIDSRDWSLITGRGGGGGGGATKREGWHVKCYPYEKGGGGERKKFPLNRGGGGGGREKFDPVFRGGGGTKRFGPAIFSFCSPPPSPLLMTSP